MMNPDIEVENPAGCAVIVFATLAGIALIIVAMGSCSYLVSKGKALETQTKQQQKDNNAIKEEKR